MLDFGENINKHLEIINDNRIKISNSITESDLLSLLDVASLEENLLLDFKGLDDDKMCIIFKYAMLHDDRSSPLITLNLFNLLKTYNNLDESFFNSDDTYFKDITQLVDIKLGLDTETKDFLRKFSVYFLSLIKCCNKLTYSPLETVHKLPVLYQTLFCMMDFTTAAGIFSRAPEVNTNECILVEDAYKFLNLMLVKSGMAINFLADFYNEGKINGD